MSKLFDFDIAEKDNSILIGTDEAGRGPLAGPVVAAAVCFLEINDDIKQKLNLVNDSKKLSPKQREYLYDLILDNSINAITVIDVDEIEKINILQASLKAMKLSCESVIKKTGDNVKIIIDGNKKIPHFKYPNESIVKGDSKSASIASASILAKVYRDNLMKAYSTQFPQYDFAQNKGYGTKKHIDAILRYGVCPIHRKSFLNNILNCEKAEQTMLFTN